MLIHICCSVDSHYFLQKIREKYPNKKLIGYFYNPNIHPKEEYDLRLKDVARSCQMLDIELLDGEYDESSWRDGVRGLENEPEKGERCIKCFDIRLERSARKCVELGYKEFSTTLLASPLKEQERLYKEGDIIAQKYNLNFIKIDVRSNGGTQEQMALAKKDNLYRQNYCGCQYALNKSREKQDKFTLEFIDNIGKQIQPGSNEHRSHIFALRDKCEKEGKIYILYKQKTLIWRNLQSMIYQHLDKTIVDSYILANSMKKSLVKTGPIIWIEQNIMALDGSATSIKVGYPKKDDSVFIDIASFNKLVNSGYKNVRSLVSNPIKFDIELMLRNVLCGGNSINPIIILDREINSSLILYINAIFQEDSIFNIAF